MDGLKTCHNSTNKTKDSELSEKYLGILRSLPKIREGRMGG